MYKKQYSSFLYKNTHSFVVVHTFVVIKMHIVPVKGHAIYTKMQFLLKFQLFLVQYTHFL